MDTQSSRSGNGVAGPLSLPTISNSRVDDLDRLQSALAYIDPSDHDTWLKVGMGIKNASGEDGWQIFDAWSRPAPNYNARENLARWRSFKSGPGITIATVYHLARGNGWREDQSSPRATITKPHRLVSASTDEVVSQKGDAAKRLKAEVTAAALWSAATTVAHSPYCTGKGFTPPAGLREIAAHAAASIIGSHPSGKNGALEGQCLVVPIKIGSQLASVQLIDGAGRKYFLKGSSVAGGWWPAQALPLDDSPEMSLLIGEGVATVVSATTVTGHPGVVALMNSNIPTVAAAMRERYPTARIIVLADCDKLTGAPDRHAIKAASAVGGKLAVPQFERGRVKDFNDAMLVHGADAVSRAIENAVRPTLPSDFGERGSEQAGEIDVRLVRAGDITPEPISWVWPGHLARGKLHILGGKPSAGKTTLALAMAARITRGGTWPDGTPCPQGDVVVWSGEDDPKDTIVPRLLAADADLSRVHIVSDALQSGEPVPFDPARHMPALAIKLKSLPDFALLIVDPVVSAVAGDSHKNAEVRRALQPLVDLAYQSSCAALGITHFTKGTAGNDPLERLTGSLAFGALPRIVLLATQSQTKSGDAAESSPKRLLMRAKSNIGPDGGGFEYQLQQRDLPDHPGVVTSVVVWGAAVAGSARDLLAEAETGDETEGTSLAEAKDWLADLLGEGPVAQPDVMAKARQAGHARATVRRAKKSLGIKSRKQGISGGWAWEMPRRCSVNAEGAPLLDLGTFGEE